MPKLKFDHVVTFSSEDPAYPANNLLSNDSTKKWKCQTVGEKSASVVLQLEKASVISGIDIGNEHSAYVEVLVSRSSNKDDFQALLVMSSFMTPLESRQSTNINKVRMFNQDQLQKPECTEKWDRVKIVCTQPFNRHVQYGLAFVTLHSPQDKESTEASVKLGKFTLRPASPDTIAVGSLFARRNEQKNDTPLTAAAAIRDACSSSSLAESNSSTFKPKVKQFPPSTKIKPSDTLNSNEKLPSRNRDELLYSKDEEQHHEKIDKIMKQKAKEKEEHRLKEEERKIKEKEKTKEREKTKEKEKRKGETKDKHINDRNQSKTDRDDRMTKKNNEPSTSTNNKRKMDLSDSPSKKPKRDKPTKPFNQLFDGVVIVISGIQNPDRANIRSKALEMGAKYKSDWDNTCTHLICAFPNTPKFNQVRGKGKIINKSWVPDCYSQRKRLPWRRYALDKNDVNKNESEDEIWEQIDEPVREDTPELIIQDDTDSECSSNYQQKQNSDDEPDTEDEIERIQKLEERKTSPNPYEVETDDENIQIDSKIVATVQELPNFFDNKIFYIDKNMDDKDVMLLKQYITAFNGNIMDDPSEVVDLVISTEEGAVVLKELCSKASVVSPDWVWECHNVQQWVPVDKFVL